jgi:hypothetical protein
LRLDASGSGSAGGNLRLDWFNIVLN